MNCGAASLGCQMETAPARSPQSLGRSGYSDRMQSAFTSRIERELGLTGLVDALTTLPASDLRSLLMDVYRTRATGVTEATIAAHAARDPLMTPSTASARDLMAFDSIAFQPAPEFIPLHLSPVCRFSAASILGGTSQNNVLTTIRNAEVLGDPTIALALEAARRRRSGGPIRLCASQRVIRLQPFDVPGYSPHFRLFALVTAGRDSGSLRFEMEHLTEHVSFYLRLCRALSSQGFRLENPLVEISDVRATTAALSGAGVSPADVREAIRAHDPGAAARFLAERNVSLGTEAPESAADLARLAREVFEPLRSWYPEAEFRTTLSRLEGLGY